MQNNNNPKFVRSSVLFIAADITLGLKRANDLFVLDAEPIVGDVSFRPSVIAGLGGLNYREWFQTRSETVDGNVIVLGVNPERDSKLSGDKRESDARRIGRGLAHLRATLDARKAKKIKAGQYLTFEKNGNVAQPVYDEDGKPFTYFTIGEVDGLVTPIKWTKVEGKFSKKDSKASRDATAPRMPLDGTGTEVLLDRIGIAALLEKGFIFVIPGEFTGLVRENYALNLSLLNEDYDAFQKRVNALREKEEANKRAYFESKGMTVIG